MLPSRTEHERQHNRIGQLKSPTVGAGMAPGARQHHRSFLLRLWRAGNGHAPEWRCSLEDTRTRERHGFADLAGLLAFLEGQIGDSAPAESIVESNETGTNK